VNPAQDENPVNPAQDQQAQDAPADQRPVGYSIVLPPGWRRIPVRWGSKKAIREAVDEAFSVLPKNAPRDKVGAYRIELERYLTDLVRDARTKGGIDLYLPVLPVYGAPLPASFVVADISEALRPAGEVPDPAQAILLFAADNDNAHPVTMDGAMGLRIEKTGKASIEGNEEFGAHQVDYVLSVPGTRDRWLAVYFATLGGGNPDDQVAALLTSLFDAMMTTFRWEQEVQGEPA
jgi:hypothetical protein